MEVRVLSWALLMENYSMIIFTKHALEKFKILKQHDCYVTKEQILKTIANPEKIDYSRKPLLIAQSKFDTNHVLRVVYKKEKDLIKIITFYPGRKKQYEK